MDLHVLFEILKMINLKCEMIKNYNHNNIYYYINVIISYNCTFKITLIIKLTYAAVNKISDKRITNICIELYKLLMPFKHMI